MMDTPIFRNPALNLASSVFSDFRLIFTLLISLILLGGCNASRVKPTIDPNASYWTKVNMWFDDEYRIHAVNYHRGRLLPAGTPVAIEAIENDAITFRSLEDQRKYTLHRNKRRSRVRMEDLFQRSFHSREVGSLWQLKAGFSDFEKEWIARGELAKGMSKQAVLMAYGYPPMDRTPSLEHGTWHYWIDYRIRQGVSFREGRIDRIHPTVIDPDITISPIQTEKTRIAVMDFRNRGSGSHHEWLTIGLADMTKSLLSRIEGVELIERRDLKTLLQEQELSMAGVIERDLAPKIGGLLGAQHMVFGVYRVSGDRIHIDLRLVAIERGQILRAESGEGSIDQVNSIIESMVLNLSGILGHRLSEQEKDVIRRDGVNMMKTLKALSRGDLLLDRGEIDKARALYVEALRREPANPAVLERIKDIDISRNAIAIMDFQNVTGEAHYEHLSNAVPEALTTLLMRNTGLPFTERLNLVYALKEIELGQSGLIDPETAVKVGNMAGATQMVVGSYTIRNAEISLNARIIDAENGQVLTSEQAQGPLERLDQVERTLAERLITTLKEVRVRKSEDQAINRLTKFMGRNTRKVSLVLEESMVGFDFNSATLKPSSHSILNRVADILKQFPDYRIMILGHTDGEGSKEYNEVLSGNRARSVLEYMVRRGVPPSRLSSIGYGETRPIATNDTPGGRARNRRVEFMLINK